MYENIPDNPYLLLTPGPLSTSKGVRNAMLRDWCTWDSDYNEAIVQKIRSCLTDLATSKSADYTAVLMQGSGTFSVEACLGSVIPKGGKVLFIINGAYGKRMTQIAKLLKIDHIEYICTETEIPDVNKISEILTDDPDISHVAMVHCETTTGILNPLREIADLVKDHGKIFIVDAMSSFGGIPMDMGELGIDYLISSSNKCIQGVPGFGFVIARRDELLTCEGNARTLSLDLYDQWKIMEATGKWRFTSPTHVVKAFLQALVELYEEGGIKARHQRYKDNQILLTKGMTVMGYKPLLPDEYQSPIITSFLYPSSEFDFRKFYDQMKEKGFVLYPGKISQADTFRIGNIGEIYLNDIRRLLDAISACRQ